MLLRLTDASLTLLDHQIAALWRIARERVEESRASRLRRFRQLLGQLAGLADDDALGAAELRSRLRSLIAPFEPARARRPRLQPFVRNLDASPRIWLGC